MNEGMLSLQRSLRRNMVATIVMACVLLGALGGWAATTEIAGAVIAQGQLVVNSNLKKVQHPTGGIVGQLRVREGDRVKAGDIIIRLDDTQTRANHAIASKALNELAARQAREEAERDGADSIDFPENLLARMDNPDVAKAVNGERKQFEVRRTAREGQRAQLKERIAGLKEETRGYQAQVGSKNNQIDWITKELAGVNELWKKNLIPYTRLTLLEREKERLDGERGQLIAAIGQSKGKITETELQIIQIDQDMRAEVGKDLADIRGKTAELVEKKVAAEDLLNRVDIRAPEDGIIHQLSVHTVGGVIGAGEAVTYIVPEADVLQVEGKILPQDIDQVRLGQLAFLRFTTFNMRTTPELIGEVSRISGDVSEDQKSGGHYYTVRISVSDAEIARLRGLSLKPGMPVECFIQTNARTVMSYLVRPLGDQMMRTFREK
jgi:membrane fusion protein, type I secretion system